MSESEKHSPGASDSTEHLDEWGLNKEQRKHVDRFLDCDKEDWPESLREHVRATVTREDYKPYEVEDLIVSWVKSDPLHMKEFPDLGER